MGAEYYSPRRGRCLHGRLFPSIYGCMGASGEMCVEGAETPPIAPIECIWGVSYFFLFSGFLGGFFDAKKTSTPLLSRSVSDRTTERGSH